MLWMRLLDKKYAVWASTRICQCDLFRKFGDSPNSKYLPSLFWIFAKLAFAKKYKSCYSPKLNSLWRIWQMFWECQIWQISHHFYINLDICSVSGCSQFVAVSGCLVSVVNLANGSSRQNGNCWELFVTRQTQNTLKVFSQYSPKMPFHVIRQTRHICQRPFLRKVISKSGK